VLRFECYNRIENNRIHYRLKYERRTT